MPTLLDRAGERVHALETRERENHQGPAIPREIQEQRDERPPLLHQMWRPCHDRSPDARLGRRSRSAERFRLQANRPFELRGGGAPDARWTPEAQGFPRGNWGNGPDATRVVPLATRHFSSPPINTNHAALQQSMTGFHSERTSRERKPYLGNIMDALSGSQARTLRREAARFLRVGPGKSCRSAANRKPGNKIDALAGA